MINMTEETIASCIHNAIGYEVVGDFSDDFEMDKCARAANKIVAMLKEYGAEFAPPPKKKPIVGEKFDSNTEEVPGMILLSPFKRNAALLGLSLDDAPQWRTTGGSYEVLPAALYGWTIKATGEQDG